jgi:hypothetical protein
VNEKLPTVTGVSQELETCSHSLASYTREFTAMEYVLFKPERAESSTCLGEQLKRKFHL